MRRLDSSEIRAIGYLAVVLSVPLLVLFLANLSSHLYFGGPDYCFLLWIAIFSGVTGFGLVRLRKWAAVLLLLGTAGFGSFLIVLSLLRTQFPGSLLSIPWGALFFVPSFLVLPSWKALK
jgi:hypothetical protein